MRTLVATSLINSKGKPIYCSHPKLNFELLKPIRASSREQLEDAGFTFISLVSPDYPNIKGYAIFYEGHLDEMEKKLKAIREEY